MKAAKILVYDGSFNGFLTAVFTAFEEKIAVADIQRSHRSQNGLFSETKTIITHKVKAKRVWDAIQKKNHNTIRVVYFAFLSERKNVEMLLYSYIRHIFKSNGMGTSEISEQIVSRLNQLSEMVGREKYRLEAALKFEQANDEAFFATISPDYNILPLISKHFRSRYAAKKWTIYDLKRMYGLYYNGVEVEFIKLDKNRIPSQAALKGATFSGGPEGNREFWSRSFHKKQLSSQKSNDSNTAFKPIGLAV